MALGRFWESFRLQLHIHVRISISWHFPKFPNILIGLICISSLQQTQIKLKLFIGKNFEDKYSQNKSFITNLHTLRLNSKLFRNPIPAQKICAPFDKVQVKFQLNRSNRLARKLRCISMIFLMLDFRVEKRRSLKDFALFQRHLVEQIFSYKKLFQFASDKFSVFANTDYQVDFMGSLKKGFHCAIVRCGLNKYFKS